MLNPNTREMKRIAKEHMILPGIVAMICLTVKDMMHYSLSLSDNNASNVMFRELVGVATTDT